MLVCRMWVNDARGIKGMPDRISRSCPKQFCLLIAAAALSVLLSAFSVHSHVLEGPHVLELMTRNLAGAKTLRVDQQVTLIDSATPEQELVIRETLSYFFPDRFRSDTRNAQIERIFVQSGRETITIVDGYRTDDPESRFDRYKDLLLYRSRYALHKMLLSSNVDTGTTSLGIFEGRVVYVIGADYPDESVSQVWVDKESLLPVRWINVSSDEPDERIEFLYRDWQKKDNLWYPARVETQHQGRLIRRIDAIGLAVDADLHGDLFDIAQLMRNFPSEESVATPAVPESGVDEVQRAIEQFQQKFEN